MKGRLLASEPDRLKIKIMAIGIASRIRDLL